MNNAKKIVEEITDQLAEGFQRIDPKTIEARPPKIAWGDRFQSWPAEKQILWLIKFAETMNHAADLLQKERDELNALCEKKEMQVTKLTEMMHQNNAMLQQEVTRFNEQRQDYNKEIARLNAKIRGIEGGN